MPELKKNRVRHSGPRKRRRPIMGMVGILVLFSAFVAISTQRTPMSEALAQPHIHSNHAPGQQSEPLLDGSKQPQLIPDDVAIRVLMQTLRIRPNPDSVALEQLRARVARASTGAR